MKYDIAIVGLAVMGENLARNIASKGFKVAVYNRHHEKAVRFIETYGTKDYIAASTYQELVSLLKKPRKITLMIKAGKPVDMVLDDLVPLLESGDIVIDGGNSNFQDTIRRTEYLEQNGLRYIGAGISGGEEGALHGPSIMPGGSRDAWPHVKDILQSIAAKTKDGEICCNWVGSDGAGHFVKMVHNGIEYGDIQLITEVYQIMRTILHMTPDEMHKVFYEWNKSELNSYLIEITADILAKKDDEGNPLVDKILDTAGQKGTGKWTVINSLDEGVSVSVIAEAVYARLLSAQKEERVEANRLYQMERVPFKGDKEDLLESLKDALYIAKMISYAQGFLLIQEASITYSWDINLAMVSSLWKGGCIIRSAFLDKIKQAYNKNKNLNNLLLDDYFHNEIKSRVKNLRKVVSEAVLSGISVPSLSAGLTYLDGLTTASSPANLLQAMRDYFGAHTYERVDKPRGEFFHTNWTGKGGDTSSSTYNV